MMSTLKNDWWLPLGRCPACDAQGAKPFAQRSSLNLVRCPECSLVYSDPQPRGRVLAKYLREYDLAAHFGAVSDRKRVLFARRMSELQELPGAGRRVCDVGCADGQFLEIARDRGWNCFGVELNPPAAARARARGLTVFEGEFETLHDLPWNTFDLVTCWDCLEHTPEPRVFAEKLVALARPGATIMITTLNLRSLVFRVFGARWSMIVEDHFTYWTLRSLGRLFAEAGCQMTHCKTYGLGRDFVGWLDSAQRLRGRRPRRPPPEAEISALSGQGWDVKPVVLAMELGVNRILNATGSGVGLSCAFRRL